MGLARMARKTDTRIIYDVHGNMAQEARLNSRGMLDLVNHFNYLQYSVMEKIAAKYSDYFAVCSESFRDYYVSKGVEGERIEVVLNGVNIGLFKPRDVPKKDVFTVTYAGRFQKWQGIELLLEAARLLKDEDVRFRVIGLDSRTRKAMEGKYNNVEFMDFMPEPEADRLPVRLRRADHPEDETPGARGRVPDEVRGIHRLRGARHRDGRGRRRQADAQAPVRPGLRHQRSINRRSRHGAEELQPGREERDGRQREKAGRRPAGLQEDQREILRIPEARGRELLEHASIGNRERL